MFELLIPLIGIFLLNMLSNSIGTLKTIFIAKRQLKPAYIVTFMDAFVFAIALKQIAEGDGFWFLVAFSLGKVAGVYVGDRIDRMLELGVLEAEIYLSNIEKVSSVADSLRDAGMSVNTIPIFGINGNKRYAIQVTLPKNGVVN